MPQCKPFGVFDALVIAVLRSAGYKPDTPSVKVLETDEKALAIWNDKKTIRRQIYRSWPRDPKGEKILPENSCLGKMTSNGIQFWGATLWDFYWVHRLPDLRYLITVSTGSKLSKWMIEHKETEHAASEIEWAQIEADPREINPYAIANVIEAQEMSIRLGLCGKSMPHILAGQAKGQETGNEKEHSIGDNVLDRGSVGSDEGSNSEASDEDKGQEAGDIDDNDSSQGSTGMGEGSESEVGDEAKYDKKDQMAIDEKEEQLDESADSGRGSTRTAKGSDGQTSEEGQQPVTVRFRILNV